MNRSILSFILFSCFFCASCHTASGQKNGPYGDRPLNRDDSICKFGKRYDRPQRKSIDFPAKKVTDRYKIKALHHAVPDSLNNENSSKNWLYNYYFTDKVRDYDENGDSTFSPVTDNLMYKLKDTYFFDINGDGKLDFVHYPKYYRALMLDFDAYEMFLQINDSAYKMITFHGFIIDINFNKDGSLNNMKTYQGPCCDDDHATFYSYIFDRNKNDLVLINKERILTCQLIDKK